jgi:drug/metabolite transporter (DMT)-like permease
MLDRSIPAAAYGLSAALALFWGLSWPLMKLALTEMPPLRFRAFAIAVGAVGMVLVALASGNSLRITRQAFWRIAGVAMFTAVGWSLCMAYGLRLMESGRAAILAYTFPVWSVPLSAWILDEALTKRRLLGLALGMGGMGLLMGDEIYAVGRAPLGAALMFGTAACWAFGTILAKKWSVPVPAITFTAWLSLIGLVPILLLSIAIEEGPFLPFGLSTGPMLGALYAGVFAALICQWAWFKLVSITTASVASMSILAVPVVGVFFSLLVLHEIPRASDYAALLLVVASLATVILPGRPALRAPESGAGPVIAPERKGQAAKRRASRGAPAADSRGNRRKL